MRTINRTFDYFRTQIENPKLSDSRVRRCIEENEDGLPRELSTKIMCFLKKCRPKLYEKWDSEVTHYYTHIRKLLKEKKLC